MTKKLFETPSANKKKLLKYSILNLRENLNGLKKKSEFYLQQNQNFLIQRENGKKLKKVKQPIIVFMVPLFFYKLVEVV